MTASLAEAIRRHVEALGDGVRRIWVHPDDYRAVVGSLDSRWRVAVVGDEDVPRVCWRVDER